MIDNLESLFKLEGKTIIITGAAGLLGVQHAEAIAEMGGAPILLDLNEQSCQEIAQKISKKFNVNAKGFSCDITQEKAIIRVRDELHRRSIRVDGLINNAANNPKMDQTPNVNASRLENYSIDDWNQDFAVGVTGAFLCSRVFGADMAVQRSGVIVNVSSDLGVIAPDQRLYSINGVADDKQNVKPVSYSVTKHALIGLTKYLATYWADKGVRANTLCPGGVFNNQSDELVVRISERIPMGRMANADEYKGAIQFLCSNASAYMNGGCLVVDGGRIIW